jgi:hypothetical protein
MHEHKPKREPRSHCFSQTPCQARNTYISWKELWRDSNIQNTVVGKTYWTTEKTAKRARNEKWLVIKTQSKEQKYKWRQETDIERQKDKKTKNRTFVCASSARIDSSCYPKGNCVLTFSQMITDMNLPFDKGFPWIKSQHDFDIIAQESESIALLIQSKGWLQCKKSFWETRKKGKEMHYDSWSRGKEEFPLWFWVLQRNLVVKMFAKFE